MPFHKGDMDTNDNNNEITPCDNPNCAFHDPEMIERYRQATLEGHEAGLIKVHFTIKGDDNLGGETCWAVPLDDGFATICNVPFFVDASYGDLVHYTNVDGINEVDEVIDSRYQSVGVTYPYATEEEARSLYREMFDHCEGKGMKVEGMQAGIAIIAFPTDKMSEAEALAIITEVEGVDVIEVEDGEAH